jgi:hypothetical protein
MVFRRMAFATRDKSIWMELVLARIAQIATRPLVGRPTFHP